MQPTRFKTVKLVSYAIRRRGGRLERNPYACPLPTYTLRLPNDEPQGPFDRYELISWANQHL